MADSGFKVPVGVVCVEEYTVKEENTAKHVGSGDVAVLSTPSMIAFMEETSMKCAQQYLPRDYTTVGVAVNVKHVNPAPLGSTIRVESRILSHEGKRIVYEVKAYYKGLLVGEGLHERFIVNRERFAEKVKRLLEAP